MGFLVALLPGLRDLRTPFSVGVLWFGVLLIVLTPHADSLLEETPRVDALKDLLTAWPTSLLVPAAFTAAFLLGMLITAPTLFVMRRVGQLLGAALRLVSCFQPVLG